MVFRTGSDALLDIAERQWRDYQAHNPGTYFAEQRDALDLGQAYSLQSAVSRLRIEAGDRVVGYKVGCTGAGTIEQFGMAGPIRGYLYQSELRRSGETLDSQAYANLAIEGEMALLIGRDGEPNAAFPVIELHNFVFRGARKTLVELVADNGLNAGVVQPVGEWLLSTKYLAADATLTVQVNDRLLGLGGLWPVPGGASDSLHWLRCHLDASGLVLSPGDLILAGTSLGLYPVKARDHVVVSIDGVSVTECFVI